MALHFPLKINSETIGTFTAIRKSGGIDPDDVNVYEVPIETKSAEDPNLITQRAFNLDHRYGDGAWVLVRKALEQLT
ncbi:hypothetical protein [Rhodococcus qingshengii]|uniref:hypothetical protein n=1 Tax=Rhodococcus qingshengii TaxID=334542 RepID=UPI0035E24120